MASSEIRAGGAYIEATVKDKTASGLDAIQKRVGSIGDKLSGIGQKLALVGVAMVGAFVPAIKAAGDLNEINSKFDVVFAENAKSARKFADDFAQQVGRSKQTLYDFMAGAQNLFVPIGFDKKAATELSQTVAKLAVDLASFGNTSDEDALQAIKSGLLGEAEPMKRFGVIVNETATQMELLNQKIDPDAATDAQKTYARLAIIIRATKDAQGDAARTADSFANQVKRLQGQVLDAGAAIGGQLIPVATKFVSTVGGAVQAIAEWASQNQKLLTIVVSVGGALVAFGAAAVVIGKVISVAALAIPVFNGIATAIGVVKTASLALLASPLGLALAAFAAVGALIGVMAYKASQNMDGLTKASERAAEASKKLTAGDERRAGDQAAIERLKQLNDLQSLDADQKKEVAALTAQLSGHYDGLGLSIDGTTGKVKGLAGAFEVLATRMKAQAVDQVTKDIQEQQAKLQALRDSQGKSGFHLDGFLDTITLGEGGFSGDNINNKHAEIVAAIEKLRDAKERLKALNGGDNSALTGDPKKDNSAAAIQARIQLSASQMKEKVAEEKKLAEEAIKTQQQAAETLQTNDTTAANQKYDAMKARVNQLKTVTKDDEIRKTEQLTQIELQRANELAAINKRAIDEKLALELAAIDLKYKEEAERLKKLGIDTKPLDNLKANEKGSAVAKANEGRAKEDKAQTDAKQAALDEARENQKQLEAERRKLQQDVLQAQADALEAEAGVDDKNKNKDAGDKKRQEALRLRQQIERERQEEELRTGGYSEQQKKQMRDATARAQAAQREAAKPEKVFGTAGTFNARAVDALRGNTVQDQIAKNTANQTKEQQKTNKTLTEINKNGGGKMG